MPYARSLPVIVLSPSLAHRLLRAWRVWLEQHRARRRAAAERALIDTLDAATRRDLGLGETGLQTTGLRHGPYVERPYSSDPYHF